MPDRRRLGVEIVMSTSPARPGTSPHNAAAERWRSTAPGPAAKTAAIHCASGVSRRWPTGIDAPIEAVKATDANAVGHGLAGQPGLQELSARHHTVLALGKPTDQNIGTLVTFDVYRTSKVISVGHALEDGRPY
jgi:hypothetical protein